MVGDVHLWSRPSYGGDIPDAHLNCGAGAGRDVDERARDWRFGAVGVVAGNFGEGNCPSVAHHGETLCVGAGHESCFNYGQANVLPAPDLARDGLHSAHPKTSQAARTS